MARGSKLWLARHLLRKLRVCRGLRLQGRYFGELQLDRFETSNSEDENKNRCSFRELVMV